MLKFLRLSATLIAILTTPISNAVLTPPTIAADSGTLNAQLKQAVCTQDWGEAVNIVDQFIAITPSSNQKQHSQLETYRERMQNLSVSRTNVDDWLESYCTAPVATSAVINTGFDTNTTQEQASEQSDCSPSYPDVCISDSGEDLNCADIPYSNLKVLPPDPHGFDGDGDGIGCES